MFCPKCRIDVNNTEYCEFCGAKTVGELRSDNTNYYPGAAGAEKDSFKISIPKLSFRSIVTYSLMVVLLLSVFLGVSKLKSYFKPEVTAQRYANYLVTGQYDKAFNLLETTDDKFFSKEYFERYIDTLDIKDKKIVEVNSAAGYAARIEHGNLFSTKEEDPYKNEITRVFMAQIEDNIYEFTLIKKGKKFGVFDNWMIANKDFAKKWLITVPKGAKIKVDDIAIEKVQKTQDFGGFSFMNNDYKVESVTYVIDNIYPGEYEITAVMDGAIDVKEKAKSTFKKDIVFEMKPELAADLQKQTQKFLELYYSNADKSAYKDIVSPESNFLKNFNNNNGSNNDYLVRKIESLEIDSKNSAIEDISHARLALEAKIYYEREFAWFFGEKQKQTGTDTTYLNFLFKNVDGKWLIADTGFIY